MMKYFLRWSERRHCWEMCVHPEHPGNEPVIVGHLSLKDMDRVISREVNKKVVSLRQMRLSHALWSGEKFGDIKGVLELMYPQGLNQR